MEIPHHLEKNFDLNSFVLNLLAKFYDQGNTRKLHLLFKGNRTGWKADSSLKCQDKNNVSGEEEEV